MQLESDAFIRRFLMHVLPDGFMRIRHYGFMANACRHKKPPLIMEAIRHQNDKDDSKYIDGKARFGLARPSTDADNKSCQCPKCDCRILFVIKTIPLKINTSEKKQHLFRATH